MSGERVVVWDPDGKLPEGLILIGQQADVASKNGVTLLPCDLQLLRRSAIGGYAKRCYGQGWSYDPLRAERGASLLLFVSPDAGDLVWAARLVPAAPPTTSTEQAEGAQRNIEGHLRAALDTTQPGSSLVGLSPQHGPQNLAELGPPDEHGGWTIGGRLTLTAQGECLVGLMLYGAAFGVRVAWMAAGQGR